MPRRAWIGLLCFWPGLSQILAGQEVFGLLLAGSFAATVNMAVVARWGWVEAFAPGWADFFAAAAILTWSATFAYSTWSVWFRRPDRCRADIERLYREAVDLSLQGRWDESRRRIERILTLDETDVDALMHLGAIHVRSHRPDLARRAYRQCLELDGGVRRRWEVDRALDALERPHA